MRGVPEIRQPLAASAHLPELRPCRLLRRFSQQARDSAFPRHRPSRDRGLRSAGRLGLVLHRQGAVRPVETADAAEGADPALLLSRAGAGVCDSATDARTVSPLPHLAAEPKAIA